MTATDLEPVPPKEPGALTPLPQQLSLLFEAKVLSPTGLELPDTITFDQFEDFGSLLGRLKRTTSWWIGDWLNAGENLFGDTVYQAAEATGLSAATLAHYAIVCKSISPNRRREHVPFGVHAVVASLSAKEQTKWLGKAEANNWTANQLRSAIRDANAEPAPPPQPLWSKDVDANRVIELATQIIHTAQPDGDAFRVDREIVVQLRVALGEEDAE